MWYNIKINWIRCVLNMILNNTKKSILFALLLNFKDLKNKMLSLKYALNLLKMTLKQMNFYQITRIRIMIC